jgi:hypothetical protein
MEGAARRVVQATCVWRTVKESQLLRKSSSLIGCISTHHHRSCLLSMTDMVRMAVARAQVPRLRH